MMTNLTTFPDVPSVLNPAVINDDWQIVINNILAQLPASNRTLLECRLLDDEPQVDLSQSFLADDLNTLELFLSEEKKENLKWTLLREFLEKQNTLKIPLIESLKQIWLEYDLHLVNDETLDNILPLPAIFLSLLVKGEFNIRNELLVEVVDQYFCLLIGKELAPQFAKAYLKCIDFLPAATTPTYIGFIPSRVPFSVRAQFRFMEKNQVEPYLKSIGLGSIPRALTVALDLAFEYFKSAVLCFDLSPEISPRIGLELFPPKDEGDEMAKLFLSELVNQGLCSKSKCEAILAWPCSLNPANCSEAWPAELIMQSLQKSSEYFSVHNQNINHFKLVCQPGQAVEAKVYLEIEQWAKFSKA